MKKQKGCGASNVGIPHAFTVSFAPGTVFFTKLRNARATSRSSGWSSRTYGLFFVDLRGCALMKTPFRCGLAKMLPRALVAEVYSSRFPGCVKGDYFRPAVAVTR